MGSCLDDFVARVSGIGLLTCLFGFGGFLTAGGAEKEHRRVKEESQEPHHCCFEIGYGDEGRKILILLESTSMKGPSMRSIQ